MTRLAKLFRTVDEGGVGLFLCLFRNGTHVAPVLPERDARVEERPVPRSFDWFDVEDVAVRIRGLAETKVANPLDKTPRHLRHFELLILEEPSRWTHVRPQRNRFVRNSRASARAR